MCVGIPSKIVQINGFEATIDTMGTERVISLQLMSEDVALGDYVICQAGSFATQKIDEAEALETIKLFQEYAFGDETEGQAG